MKRDIAVIGMAGRFPDANTLEELYANLTAGKDSVREISPGRIKNTTLPAGKEYRVCGYLEDIDKFDHRLFNLSMAEAQTMAPELRLLLEVAYETFENSGYGVDFFNGTDTSVFLGEVDSRYYELAEEFSRTLITGCSVDYFAARIARQFNLTGNAAVVNTSCSSSLVAVHMACAGLLLGECSYALVCGVNLNLFPFKKSSPGLDLESPDGKSRAFSAGANGMSFGEVAAALLLKPLEAALADNDAIHAVIKGSAVNNNGSRSSSPTAPDSRMQAEVLKKAWRKAGIKPAEIGYIEAHGSGTQLGDSLEIEGLNLAFASYKTGNKHKPVPISTIKSNTGHGRGASGIAGLIKTVLSLKHKIIFPTIHFHRPSPIIDFQHSAVYVNERLKKWRVAEGAVRLAGLTSVGASGINCHVVLAEAPQAGLAIDEHNKGAAGGFHLITVSSASVPGLKENLKQLKRKLSQDGHYRLQDISFTLNKGRKHYNYRAVFVVDDPGILEQEIEKALASTPTTGESKQELEKLIFIFSSHEKIPGNLSNHFLSHHPVFQQHYNRCKEYRDPHREKDGHFCDFAFQYSLYKLFEAYGIVSENILGIGIGGIISRVISNEITLRQGVREAFLYKDEPVVQLEERVDSLVERETGKEPAAFIEMGPPGILSKALKKKDPMNSRFYVFWLPEPGGKTDGDSLLELFRLLYLANYNIDWQRFFKHNGGSYTARKIELPVYSFEKTRCWIRENPPADVEETKASSTLLKEAGSEIQQKIADLWHRVLEIDTFSLDDDFFEMGGDSLKASKVIHRINDTFSLDLNFEDIFDFPTLRSLGRYIGGLLGTEQKMTVIWKDVLKNDRVNREDNFFQLGGHSLLASQVINRVKKEFCLELNFEDIFRNPTLISLCKYIDNRLSIRQDIIEYGKIEPEEEKEYYPLSSAQKRLYLLQQLEPGNISYNNPMPMLLEGKPDRGKLEATFRRLIRRHESLRTSFRLVKDTPVQQIHHEVDFEIVYHHSSLIIHRSFIRPFDLSLAPLLRVGLITLEETRYILVMDMHHIITDGISMSVFTGEFVKLYRGEELPALRTRYRDFSAWQNKLFYSEQEQIKKQEEFWLRQFAGEIPVLEMPYDYVRPRVLGFAGGTLDFELGIEETHWLRQLVLEQGTTLFMVLLALYNVFLARLTGREDLVIGTPTAGRRHVDLERIIGMFVNTLALRNYPRGEKTFVEFLRDVTKKAVDAFENQDYQFEDLVDQLVLKRDMGRNPLFDVMFSLRNMPIRTEENLETGLEGLKIGPYNYENRVSMFDLTLTVRESGEGLTFTMEYCTELFKKETIGRFTRYFKQVVFSILTGVDIKLREIDIIPDDEKEQLLYKFNDTAVEYPVNRGVHELFEEQAGKTPGHTVVVGPSHAVVTYLELNKKSHRLAYVLRKKGVKPDTVVGIMAERSPETLAGILAILKAGGAYLPIDPVYPAGRINYMLKDSGAGILLKGADFTPGALLNISEGHPLPPAARNLQPAASLAYVIYTSGTTGKPKGVMVEHRNLAAYLHAFYHVFEITARSTIIQQASYSFDQSVEEIYPVILRGGRIVIPPKSIIMDSRLLSGVIVKHNIDIISCSPLLLNELNKHYPPAGKCTYISGGDLLKREYIDNLLTVGRVYNTYGPTEAAVCATYIKCSGGMGSNIPIGKPISNYIVYILDGNAKLQPVGVPGELCISGPGIARGYLNRSELTSEKFFGGSRGAIFQKSPPGRRRPRGAGSLLKIYKTGDLGRWLSDGNIEFLGRGDQQVKIRGFRIEPGEIEHGLMGHDEVEEAVVLAQEDTTGDKYLCAYVVLHSAAASCLTGLADDSFNNCLKEYLSAKLPSFMVPAHFVKLPGIPRNVNGKLDRNALPKPGIGVAGDKYTAPRGLQEERLEELWSELLGIEQEKIGIDADFFELGGHSLRAVGLLSKIHKNFNVKVPLAEIFKTPTIRGLSGYIQRAAEEKYTPVEAVEEKEYYALSSAQKRLYILQQLDPESTVYNMPGAIELDEKVDKQKLAETFKKLIHRHGALRTSFEMVDEEPVQEIHHDVEFEVECYDPGDSGSGQWTGFVSPFELSKAPLLRAGLIQGEKENPILLVDMHHIISDGVSGEILSRDFINLYNGKTLPALRLHYKDFSQWQNREMEADAMKKQGKYWLRRFKNPVPPLKIPTDYPEETYVNVKPGLAGGRLNFELDEGGTGNVRKLARETGCTLFVFLLAVYNILLSKYALVEDIVVGTPAAGRRHADLQDTIGMFVNLLAIRNFPGAHKTFNPFLLEVKENFLDAFENQDYQFEELVAKLGLQRESKRNPLVETVLVSNNMNLYTGELSGQENIGSGRGEKDYEFENPDAKFDLTLGVIESKNRIKFDFEYRKELFKKETIVRMSRHFTNIIREVTANPNLDLSEIQMLSDEEKNEIKKTGVSADILEEPVETEAEFAF